MLDKGIIDNHMMVDTETLSTKPHAVVLSIGVAVFDNEKVFASNHWRLSIEDQIACGRDIQASTLSWWMTQSEEARRRAFGSENRLPTSTVAECIRDMRDHWGVSTFWAHSPAFDYVILDSLFGPINLWTHKSWYDTRTLGAIKGRVMTSVPGTAHDPEADACHQAQWVIECFR